MGGTWDTEQCKIVLKEKLTNISKCTKENGLKTFSITEFLKDSIVKMKVSVKINTNKTKKKIISHAKF